MLSGMSEPLGWAVGNALEVTEAVRCLQGEGPDDLLSLCLTLAETGLRAAGLSASRETLEKALASGHAYEKLEAWIAAQGGDARALGRLETAPGQHPLRAEREGFVASLDALALGQAVKVLGGGRAQKGDAVDPGVGLVLHAKVGDPVRAGDRLVGGAVVTSEVRAEPPPLVLELL